jgi:hypothetical protein
MYEPYGMLRVEHRIRQTTLLVTPLRVLTFNAITQYIIVYVV